MQRKHRLKNCIKWVAIAACIPLTVFSPKIFGSRGYYLAAFCFALLTLCSVFMTFEKSSAGTIKMSVIAVMCAMAIGGRVVFAGVPFVKPVAAIVILSGVALGPQAGFMTGALSMLVSNFMFSHGPWTVWQMLAFGLTGRISGIAFHKRKNLQHPVGLAIFSAICYVMITGPVMDLSGIFAYSMGGKKSLAVTLLAGLPVNITSAAATAVFMLMLAKPVLKKLNRIIVKYGFD